MAVKTHRLSTQCGHDFESENSTCRFCDRPATYWSQNEDGYKALGGVVYHCQQHREQGREAAAVEPRHECTIP